MQVLGSGGYGSVIALDERRVCKIQHSLPGHDAGVSAAALREMAALGRLYPHRTHRMLLHPSGTCAIEATRYRESLLDAIRRWRRERRAEAARRGAAAWAPRGWVARVLRIVAELAAELRAAHAAGFVHRDLKPENVMLDAAGRAHLIDWGMSRWAGEGAAEGAYTPGMATLWYRAPELFTGDAYGGAVDVWSLGVLLVELVAGRCPFRGSSELQQLRHYLEVLGPPPRGALPRWPFPEAVAAAAAGGEAPRAEAVWAAVPEIRDVPGLADLVDRMIRWDPRARASPEQVLLHPALSLGGGGGGEQAYPPRPLRCPAPPSPRGRAATAALSRLMRTVVLPRAAALRLPGAVAFAAGRLLLCAAASASAPRPVDALLCLDLANKLAGLQRRAVLEGLSLRRLERLTRRQVRLVNRRLGVARLSLAFIRLPAAPLARRLLGAALATDPCPAAARWGEGRARDVRILEELARFVADGRGSSGAGHRMRDRRLAALLRRAALRRVAPTLADKVMRRRLAAFVAGL